MRRLILALVVALAAPALADEAPEPAVAAENKAEAKPEAKAEADAAEAAKPEADAAEAPKPADENAEAVKPEAVKPEAAPIPEPHAAPEHAAPAAHAAPVGHAGAPAGEHAENHHPHGIVNWWSWDYGPSAKDPSHRYWPPPFGFALLNFAIFFGLMMKLGGKPLVEYVAARHEKIKRELDEAGRLRREAEARLAELETKLTGLDREVDTIVATVRQEAEEEKARILAAATEQATRIQKEAERQIEAEIERQRQTLSRAVVEAAILQAEGIIAKNLNAADQKRTTDAYVTQLEKGLS